MSLERSSEHPLAGAIVAAAEQRGLLHHTTRVHAEFGKGIIGNIDGQQVALGNDKLLQLLNVYAGALEARKHHVRMARPLCL